MTLAADHTITDGSWKGGTWNYDTEKQILTANGVELCLQRETDWEANHAPTPLSMPATPTTRRIGERKRNEIPHPHPKNSLNNPTFETVFLLLCYITYTSVVNTLNKSVTFTPKIG